MFFECCGSDSLPNLKSIGKINSGEIPCEGYWEGKFYLPFININVSNLNGERFKEEFICVKAIPKKRGKLETLDFLNDPYAFAEMLNSATPEILEEYDLIFHHKNNIKVPNNYTIGGDL